MNEVGGTFKWSIEQIRAYAAAFREGDAVHKDDKWYEVTEVVDNTGIGSIVRFPLINGSLFERGLQLNKQYRTDIRVLGSQLGFKDDGVKGGYKVVTPKDYEVQEGDKLVRLGKTVEQYSQSELTFGKVYEVVRWHEDGELVYKNDMTTALLASYLKEEDSAWGVIPRYENVKEEKDMDDKNEHSEDTRTFKVGDRVLIKANGRYKGYVGEVDGIHATDDSVTCDIAFANGNFCWVYANELELVEEEGESPEQEAFECLLSQDRDATRSILQGEISIWANVHLEHRDYDDLRQVIDILEKLEKGE